MKKEKLFFVSLLLLTALQIMVYVQTSKANRPVFAGLAITSIAIVILCFSVGAPLLRFKGHHAKTLSKICLTVTLFVSGMMLCQYTEAFFGFTSFWVWAVSFIVGGVCTLPILLYLPIRMIMPYSHR